MPAPRRTGRRRLALAGAAVVLAATAGVWSLDTQRSPARRPVTGLPATPTIAFLGDSITEGIGAPPRAGYAWVTAERLGWPIAVVDGVSGSGYLTPGYDRPMPHRVARVVASDPDVVVVAGGTNDVFTGYRPHEVARAARGLLAELSADLPDALVVVLGTFPTSADAALTGEGAVDDELRAAAAEVDAVFVDAHDLIGDALDDPGDWASYISGDGVHPNESGYRVLGEALAVRLDEIVEGTEVVDG